MLKKKALAAVLTAAIVFGFGEMVPETFSVHEHEIGIAHAAAESVAHWKCYWCGKTATSKRAKHTDQPSRAYPPTVDPRFFPCVPPHSHGWVWISGIPPYVSKRDVMVCTYCKMVRSKLKTEGIPRSIKYGCPKNKGHEHHWIITGINGR